MCKIVDCDITKLDPSKQDWFQKYFWTATQEELFIVWLTEFLYDNPSARKELMHFTKTDKSHCRTAAQHFVLHYGWTTKN